MSKKAILITAIPGAGKSTIAKKFIEKISDGIPPADSYFKQGLVIGHVINGTYVLGDYRDSTAIFPGLDMASMAIAPEFKKYVEDNDPSLFIEGDRLVGNSTIDFLMEQGYDLKVMNLLVPKELITERFKQRGSEQDPQFLKSKATKVSNIVTRMDLSMDDIIVEFSHVTPEDTDTIVEFCIDYFYLR